MYGLVKQANIFKDFKNAANERGMTEEEYRGFTNRLKEQYGHDTDYLYSDKPTRVGGSYAITNPDELAKVRDSSGLRKRMLNLKGYEGNAQTLVNSIPVEEVVLHETGHILDPEVNDSLKKANRLNRISNVSHLGTIGVPYLPEKVPNAVKWGVGAGLAGLSGVAAGKARGHINRSEDAANQFVKNHWSKELGSMDAAETKFNESLLPKARKTYGNAKLKGVGKGLLAGAGLVGNMLRK